MRMLLAVAGLMLSLPIAADTPLARFGWFADVVGSCWEGRFPDGKTLHTHCYTSQFGQFIRGTATLVGEHDGHPRQFEGDSLSGSVSRESDQPCGHDHGNRQGTEQQLPTTSEWPAA